MKQNQIETLNNLLEKNGELTTSMVLDEAKNETSPLHPIFEWDDSIAAKQYRLNQARKTIKVFSVQIIPNEDKLVHVPNIQRKSEGSYKQIKTVVKSESEFERAMSQALSYLKQAKDTVAMLESMAKGSNNDNIALLSLALKSMSTAESAISKVH